LTTSVDKRRPAWPAAAVSSVGPILTVSRPAPPAGSSRSRSGSAHPEYHEAPRLESLMQASGSSRFRLDRAPVRAPSPGRPPACSG
jgi:hypothetical protein